MQGSVFQLSWASVATLARSVARPLGLALAIAACAVTGLTAGDPAAEGAGDDLPPQLKVARENALKWWRDPANHLTTVQSTTTDGDGNRLRTIVFILRDPNGRSLAVSRAGSTEMQVFFQQRLKELLRQATQQHALSQSQVDKLELAAGLDIARFNRRVQEAMQRMNQTGDWNTADWEVDKLVAEEIAAAKSSLAAISEHCERGLFDDQSLYTRVLATLLD